MNLRAPRGTTPDDESPLDTGYISVREDEVMTSSNFVKTDVKIRGMPPIGELARVEVLARRCEKIAGAAWFYLEDGVGISCLAEGMLEPRHVFG